MESLKRNELHKKGDWHYGKRSFIDGGIQSD